MKVIFLDNDGVICLSHNWGSRYKKQHKVYTKENPRPLQKEIPVNLRFDNFDKKSILLLNELLEQTGAEIVVSSDWRNHATLDELQKYYLEQGICKAPVGVTENLRNIEEHTYAMFNYKSWLERIRILEIEHYLKEHPEITQWVAVDDLNMSPEYNAGYGLTNFVLTPRSNEGIKQSGVKEKIIKFFS